MPTNECVKITNISRQMIPIQVKHPEGDFYTDEKQVRLMPSAGSKSSIILPVRYLMMSQLEVCAGRGQITMTPIK